MPYHSFQPASRNLLLRRNIIVGIRVLISIAIEILSNVGCIISGLLEPDRKRIAVVQLFIPSILRSIAHYPMIVSILTPEKCCPGRAAKGIGDEIIRKIVAFGAIA